jgi:hypothetical protein
MRVVVQYFSSEGAMDQDLEQACAAYLSTPFRGSKSIFRIQIVQFSDACSDMGESPDWDTLSATDSERRWMDGELMRIKRHSDFNVREWNK